MQRSLVLEGRGGGFEAEGAGGGREGGGASEAD